MHLEKLSLSVERLMTNNNKSLKSKQISFLKDLSQINFDSCFSSTDDFKDFKMGADHYFNSIDETLELYSEHIFNDFFWQLDIVEQKYCFTWLLILWWQNNPQTRSFKKLIPTLFRIFEQAFKQHNIELALFLHFPIHHIYNNLYDSPQDIQRLTDQIERPLSELIKESTAQKLTAIKNEKINKDCGRINIAITWDVLAHNSCYKVLHSLLLGLEEIEHPFNINIYDFNYLEKGRSSFELQAELKNLTLNYYDLFDAHTLKKLGRHYSHLEQAQRIREKIIEDKNQILIDFPFRDLNNYLLTTRCCPLQIKFCQSYHNYDCDGIDARLAWSDHSDIKQQNIQAYAFHTLQTTFAKQYLVAPPDMKAVEKIKSQFKTNTRFIGTICRTVKLNQNDYLNCILKLLDKHPQLVFLACGGGSRDTIKNKLSQLAENKKKLLDRFIFVGQVDPGTYGEILEIFLNTAPFPSGLSLLEFMTKNKPIVHMNCQNSWPHADHLAPQESYCQNYEEYFEKVDHLLTDSDYYEKLSQASKEKVEQHCNLELSAQSFKKLILQLWQEKICQGKL